jgi:integrase
MELMAKTSGYGHCKNVLGGVKYLHAATGHEFPSDDFGLDETLQGLKRRLKGTPRMALPIEPVILRRMYEHIQIEKKSDLAMWCGFLVAFYCLFRKANVVPKDSNFDPACILTRSDIEIDNSGQRVLVYVNFSKTNQYMKESHVIPVPANSDPALDLFRHLKLLYSCVDAPEAAPAFSYSKTGFIDHRSYTVKLKALLTKSGLDPDLYSGHSFRRGGASYLYSIGGTTLMVQTLGDWSSQVFTRYLHLSIDDRLMAQELIASNINNTIGAVQLPEDHA